MLKNPRLCTAVYNSSCIFFRRADAIRPGNVGCRGRTPEQKRKLAERITQALIEDGRAKRENIQVTFVDLPPTDYAEAGVTVADQKRTP
jgi:4-oxalocrotonate tautomerase